MSNNREDARLPVKAAVSNLAAMGEGARAYQTGNAIEDNPWSMFLPEHENWNDGWLSAQLQAASRKLDLGLER